MSSFPSSIGPSTTDARYHLQALRHLYVLAAELRVLVTRGVEAGQATSVEVCVRGEREIRGVSCLSGAPLTRLVKKSHESQVMIMCLSGAPLTRLVKKSHESQVMIMCLSGAPLTRLVKKSHESQVMIM